MHSSCCSLAGVLSSAVRGHARAFATAASTSPAFSAARVPDLSFSLHAYGFSLCACSFSLCVCSFSLMGSQVGGLTLRWEL